MLGWVVGPWGRHGEDQPPAGTHLDPTRGHCTYVRADTHGGLRDFGEWGHTHIRCDPLEGPPLQSPTSAGPYSAIAQAQPTLTLGWFHHGMHSQLYLGFLHAYNLRVPWPQWTIRDPPLPPPRPSFSSTIFFPGFEVRYCRLLFGLISLGKKHSYQLLSRTSSGFRTWKTAAQARSIGVYGSTRSLSTSMTSPR